jgi:hypothetical protein
MKTIHSTHNYVLEARVTNHPITGKTVELFQTMPQAQHVRAQRIACLTLPQASFSRLAALLTDDEDSDHAQT